VLEIPEAQIISEQINKHLAGKEIENVIANNSPHKFAWFAGNPDEYRQNLINKVIEKARPVGGLIEMNIGNQKMVFSDGVQLIWLQKSDKIPEKHQLLLNFSDGTSLVAKIQMYGGIWCFKEGKWENEYYEIAREKPSPLWEEFDFKYLEKLLKKYPKKSAKAFLATEQRIPGLGNGVLQDILFDAKIHPKTKIEFLSEIEKMNLFKSIKNILSRMVEFGGRDTEKDLLGNPGKYKTKMSKKTVGTTCPDCGGTIKKTTYLGGSIYYCEICQIEK
jgi:formamidopyrimidine-DNA glycosylase